jgi:DNA-binding MarR family transcriptional regulator
MFDIRKVGGVGRSRQALIDALGVAMQRYQRSVQAFDDAVGRRLGLAATDVRCLDWLADGPKSAGALSRATGLRPAATTALIDRLERKGWVERVPSAEDRRRVLVRMTEYGMARSYELYGPLVDEGRRHLERYTPAELELMLRQVESMRELTDRHLTALAERRPGPGGE